MLGASSAGVLLTHHTTQPNVPASRQAQLLHDSRPVQHRPHPQPHTRHLPCHVMCSKPVSQHTLDLDVTHAACSVCRSLSSPNALLQPQALPVLKLLQNLAADPLGRKVMCKEGATAALGDMLCAVAASRQVPPGAMLGVGGLESSSGGYAGIAATPSGKARLEHWRKLGEVLVGCLVNLVVPNERGSQGEFLRCGGVQAALTMLQQLETQQEQQQQQMRVLSSRLKVLVGGISSNREHEKAVKSLMLQMASSSGAMEHEAEGGGGHVGVVACRPVLGTARMPASERIANAISKFGK